MRAAQVYIFTIPWGGCYFSEKITFPVSLRHQTPEENKALGLWKQTEAPAVMSGWGPYLGLGLGQGSGKDFPTYL